MLFASVWFRWSFPVIILSAKLQKCVKAIFVFITHEDKSDLARVVFVELCPAHSLTFREEVQQLTEKL